jgi:hypothetical protein
MVSSSVIVRLVAATFLLTGVAFAGSAIAKPADSAADASGDTTASAAASSAGSEASGPCARKVKVVYAGYGEAARAGCAAPSAGN